MALEVQSTAFVLVGVDAQAADWVIGVLVEPELLERRRFSFTEEVAKRPIFVDVPVSAETIEIGFSNQIWLRY